MLGPYLTKLSHEISNFGNRDPRLLTRRQFCREVARERIRSTRRAIPFCLIHIELVAEARHREIRSAARLLHRNLRVTDYKGHLGGRQFSVLLVDTDENGGRSVMDRLHSLLSRNGLAASMKLQVHRPGDDQQFPGDGPGGDRRVDSAHDRAEPATHWNHVDAGDVEVSSEAPLVHQSSATAFVKRATDLAGASIGLIVLGPVIGLAMMAIRWTSPGPVIFRQTREGLHGKPFVIYKLRTMIANAEAMQSQLKDESHRDGPAFKIHRDPRVTAVGRFLRATCLDELPQLWNVLRGDMSLVGPRPLPWHESRACNHWHRRRLDVRPGMTCYWQVNKARAETFDDWMRMDLQYVDRVTILGDFGLIAQTITVPMTGRGSQ